MEVPKGTGSASTSSAGAIRLRRAYGAPAADDGCRVLVDRVWPRGRARSALRLDAWERELGPSDELRRWFGHDPARWEEFRVRYLRELAAPAQVARLEAFAERVRAGRLTLAHGARDEQHNHAQVIAEAARIRLDS